MEMNRWVREERGDIIENEMRKTKMNNLIRKEGILNQEKSSNKALHRDGLIDTYDIRISTKEGELQSVYK